MKKCLFLISIVFVKLSFSLNAQQPYTYEGIFLDGEKVDFIKSDYNLKSIPKVFRLILDNNLSEIIKLPPKTLNNKFTINGEIYSPLMFACKHQKEEIAHYLIDIGSNISFRNKHGELSLSFLAFTNSTDTILAKKLITPTVFKKKDKMGYTPLLYSVLSGNNIMFDCLLNEYKNQVHAYNSEEIKNCFMFYDIRNLYILKKICKLMNLNEPYFINKYPIEDAIIRTNLYNDVTRLYVYDDSKRVDDSTDVKIINILINNGMRLDKIFENNRSILFNIYNNHILLKYLCDKVYDLNQIDNERNTFLQFYINQAITPPKMTFNNKSVYIFDKNRDYSKELEVIEYLIFKGAKVNESYENGWVYLILNAIKFENEYILKFTLRKKSGIMKNDLIYKTLLENANPDIMSHIKQLSIDN